MSDQMISGLVQNGVMLGAFGWMLKTLVSDKLRAIATDISDLKKGRAEDTKTIHAIDNRLARVEEWREATGAALGRRASDHCTLPECPLEAKR